MPTLPPLAPAPLFLGIECGGTHTVALAAHRLDHAELRLTAGPCNLRLLSDAQLEDHFRSLAAQLPPPEAIGVGAAGVRDRADCRRLEGILERVWPGIPHQVDHDLESALAAAAPASQPGQTPDRAASPDTQVIVLSGTGSCCYGRNARGQTAKVGGWGHLLGDRGSGYDLAHRALRAAAHHLDHTGTWGPFGVSALRRLLLNEPNDLIAWLQQAGKADVAALAPDVFAAAEAKDPVARAVVIETAELLAADAAACARRLKARGTRLQFVLAGSLLLRQPAFAQRVARLLQRAYPGCRVEPLPRESAWGAVEMARRAWAAAPRPTAPSPATLPQSVPSPRAAAAPALAIPTSAELSPTERRHPASSQLDQLSLPQAIELMLSEEARLPDVLRRHSRTLATLIRQTSKRLGDGGRLFYVGAGTSGRLGVLDASECPPTFRTPPEWVQGIMAGGLAALHSAVEGAEDDGEAGQRAVAGRGVGPRDLVLGIAASGRTPFVWGALHAARERGAFTALLCFNPYLRFSRVTRPDLVLALDVGPEILTGSTRLKAGTATKLVLNLLTTLTMVRLGKVVGNLMVDLNPSNVKLRDRACRIVMELTGRERAEAESTLTASGWVVTEAIRRLGRVR